MDCSTPGRIRLQRTHELVGNGNRNIGACSIVPQPTMIPRTQQLLCTDLFVAPNIVSFMQALTLDHLHWREANSMSSCFLLWRGMQKKQVELFKVRISERYTSQYEHTYAIKRSWQKHCSLNPLQQHVYVAFALTLKNTAFRLLAVFIIEPR
jgi:hypothetical protein